MASSGRTTKASEGRGCRLAAYRLSGARRNGAGNADRTRCNVFSCGESKEHIVSSTTEQGAASVEETRSWRESDGPLTATQDDPYAEGYAIALTTSEAVQSADAPGKEKRVSRQTSGCRITVTTEYSVSIVGEAARREAGASAARLEV